VSVQKIEVILRPDGKEIYPVFAAELEGLAA